MGSVNYDLAYNYTPNKNMLEYIPDYAEYFYNATGQLSEKQMLDGSNDAHFYEYNAYGQLIVVYKDRQKTQKIAEYWYDNNGNRVSKDVYNDMGDVTTTWYIRDINGNILSIYDNNNTTGTFKQSEVPVYGNNRIGVRYLAADGNTEQTLFEITDHLGNVRATFSENSGNGEPELQSKADYYPFGLKQPGASLISSYNYRFGYQGQFAEDETGETGYNAFEFRLYDGQTDRWLSPDPYGQYWSPYMAMNNNPINFVDPDGGFDTKVGAWVYSVFNGGDVRYATDKGEWFVGNQVEYTGEGIGVAYQRTFESNSSAFNSFDYRLDFTRDFMGGINDFRRQFITMTFKENLANSDKYFHSKANFDASRRGPGGEYSAEKMSNLREIIDQRFDGQSREDAMLDHEANKYGRIQGIKYRNHRGPINYKEAIPTFRTNRLLDAKGL